MGPEAGVCGCGENWAVAGDLEASSGLGPLSFLKPGQPTPGADGWRTRRVWPWGDGISHVHSGLEWRQRAQHSCWGDGVGAW